MRNNKDFFTLTSKAGRFIFPRSTRLSHAKLIRDTITAGFFGAIDGYDHPRDRPQRAKSVQAWLIAIINGPAAHNSFEWVRA